MIDALRARVKQVETESAQGSSRFRIMPILGPSQDTPRYRLLEADVLDLVRTTEVGEDGSVPELLIENQLDVHVFLMDGQELQGAKQNRILNADVLVAPKSKLHLPVSCVEAGRWHYQRDDFVPGRSASYKTRSRKARRVHKSLQDLGTYDADQGAVWDEVAEELHSAACTSETSALSDAYATREKDLDALRGELRMPENAVGLAVFDGSRFMGLDLFDRHSTLEYFWQSLVDSYALTWLSQPPDTEVPDQVETARLQQLLHKVADTDWERFDSPGEGDDYRLDSGEYVGSSLIWQDRVVLHMQVFPVENEGQQDSSEQRRRDRPRLHRRYGRHFRRD